MHQLQQSLETKLYNVSTPIAVQTSGTNCCCSPIQIQWTPVSPHQTILSVPIAQIWSSFEEVSRQPPIKMFNQSQNLVWPVPKWSLGFSYNIGVISGRRVSIVCLRTVNRIKASRHQRVIIGQYKNLAATVSVQQSCSEHHGRTGARAANATSSIMLVLYYVVLYYYYRH